MHEFGRYLTYVLVGGLCTFIGMFVLIFPQPVLCVLVLSLLLPPIGWGLSRDRPDDWWKITFLLTLPYLLLFIPIVYSMFRSNVEYSGQFWYAKYSPISFFLYGSVILLTALATHVNRSPGVRSVLLLVGGFVMWVSLLVYSGIQGSERTKSGEVTIDLLDSPRLAATMLIRCEYTKRTDYWSFRRLVWGGCGDNKVTIVKRRNIDMPLEAVWTVDGEEMRVLIHPMRMTGVPPGTPREQGWADEREWTSEMPFSRIAQAEKVTFSWGGITQELSDDQLNRFKEAAEMKTRLFGE